MHFLANNSYIISYEILLISQQLIHNHSVVLQTNLYIRGLSPSTTDEDLRKMCQQYGTITSTKVSMHQLSVINIYILIFNVASIVKPSKHQVKYVTICIPSLIHILFTKSVRYPFHIGSQHILFSKYLELSYHCHIGLENQVQQVQKSQCSAVAVTGEDVSQEKYINRIGFFYLVIVIRHLYLFIHSIPFSFITFQDVPKKQCKIQCLASIRVKSERINQ